MKQATQKVARPARQIKDLDTVALVDGTPQQLEEVQSLLARLQNKSIRVIDGTGERVTLLILQSWSPTPNGYKVRFNQGVAQAAGPELGLVEILQKLAPFSF